MVVVYTILEIINYVFIGLTSIGFLFQIVMIFFFFLKPKKFKESDKKAKIAVIVPVHNEEGVIGATLDAIYGSNYPQELYDVYVICHNCNDKSEIRALEKGAIAIPYRDENPDHKMVAYPLSFGLKKILESEKGYDFVIRFDADNKPHPDYLTKMNDAFQQGVEIARGFEASSNPTQNTWTAVSAAYYIRDSRIASNFRERAHLDSMLTGAGMMVSTAILKESGWDAFSMSEDAEYTINRLLEKKRVHYVAEAIVYEDQPSTFKATWSRLTRMGNGLNRLFWRKGFNLFGHFFKSGRWSNVDLFFQLMFVPLDVICFLWFPLYYIGYAIIHMVNANTGFFQLMTPNESATALVTLLMMAGYVILVFLVLYTVQTFLAVWLSKKSIGMEHIKGMKRGCFLSSLFMVLYGFAILAGIFTNAGWSKVERNPNHEEESRN